MAKSSQSHTGLLKKNLIIYFIFDCPGALFLRKLFSSFGKRGLLSSCGAWPSHCCGFSCYRAQALGPACFSSCGSQALEHRLIRYGAWAQLLHSMQDLPGMQDQESNPVSYIGRWILYQWATREDLTQAFMWVARGAVLSVKLSWSGGLERRGCECHRARPVLLQRNHSCRCMLRLNISPEQENNLVFLRPPQYKCGLPWWLSGKEHTCQCRRHGFDPWVGKIPWRRKWQPTPVFLPGKSHGQRSLEGYSLSIGLQRVEHDLTTKQQKQQFKYLSIRQSEKAMAPHSSTFA